MLQSDPKGIGHWRQVAAVIDGKRVPVGPGAVLTVDSNGYTVTANGKVIQRGKSKNDYEKNPHQSDVMVAEGPEAGKTLPQIFRIEGDVLVACIAPAGATRPTEFKCDAGSGHSLSVWLRTDAADAAQNAWSAVMNLPMLLVVIFALSVPEGFKKDLELNFGYWPGILVSGLIGSALVTLTCLVLKWDWRAGLIVGLSTSIGLNTFQELQMVLDPTLGALGTLAVSVSTSCVAGLLAVTVLSRLLKVRWN